MVLNKKSEGQRKNATRWKWYGFVGKLSSVKNCAEQATALPHCSVEVANAARHFDEARAKFAYVLEDHCKKIDKLPKELF